MNSNRDEWYLFCNNKTDEEIAKHFNVDENYVRVKCKKLGIPIIHFRKKKHFDNIEELAKTMSPKELATKYNVSITTIYNYLNSHNIKAVKKYKVKQFGRKSDRNAMIVELCKHFSVYDIARVFGISHQRVSEIYNREKDRM